MESQFNPVVSQNSFTTNVQPFIAQLQPFAEDIQPFTRMLQASPMSACPSPALQIVAELEQDCPALAGDSVFIETSEIEWCTEVGRFWSFDIRMEAYLNSEADRNLLAWLFREAIGRYNQIKANIQV